jgi:ribonuclease BN (tRNA processing enzyme)
MKISRVVFLGTGDAYSAGGRHTAAYLIEGSEGSLLLDCGPTFLAALNRGKLSADPIDVVFITHLHGDHFGGLPFLFLHCTNMEPRNRPLTIIGPPGIESRVMQLYRAMYADSAEEPMPYAVHFVEAQPGDALIQVGMQILPFKVPHQQNPPSYGVEIKAGDKKIVYTGDSGWTEDLVKRTQGADLFICECSFFETRLPTHLDYPRISENLPRFGARRIILTHLGEEVLERQDELEIETGHDGLVVTF